MKPINKSGKTSPMNVLGIVAVVAILAVLGVTQGWFSSKGNVVLSTTGGASGATSGNVLTTASLCPSTGTTSVTITAYNKLNTTSSQTVGLAYNLFTVNSDGTLQYYTQATTGSPVSVPCGSEYQAKLLTNATNGAAGTVLGLRTPNDKVTVLGGDSLQFKTNTATVNIAVDTKQMSALQFKLYDNNNAGFMYAENVTGTTTYLTSGARFTSTVGNTTATAIGAGGSFNVEYRLQSTNSEFDAGAAGVYVLINDNSATSVWNKPVVQFNGAILPEIKSSLDDSEANAYSQYDFVYKIADNAAGTILNFDNKLSVQTTALSGVNPSTDVSIDFARIGYTPVTSGFAVRTSSVTDAASPVAVSTLQQSVVDIS